MHARVVIRPALILLPLLGAGGSATRADDAPVATRTTAQSLVPTTASAAGRAAATPPPAPALPPPATTPGTSAPAASLPPLPPDPSGAPNHSPSKVEPPPIAPGTQADFKRTEMGMLARLKQLGEPNKTEAPAVRAVREVLDQRDRLLKAWKEAADKRTAVEHPEPSPEQVAAGLRGELARIQGMLGQLSKTPDPLLPDVFRPVAAGSNRPAEARLAEMKEAIDNARQDAHNRGLEAEKGVGDGAKIPPADLAALRAARDKHYQAQSALLAGRAEREAALTTAGAAEARDLARERFTNYEWEYRVEAERLALAEAQLALNLRQTDVRNLQGQVHASRTDLDRRVLALMEQRYAAQSESQQRALEQAVAREETRAAHTDDVLERYRAQRSAELLELEAQTVAYEKALNTTRGDLSEDRQKQLADETVRYFEKLKKLLNDGNVSTLDILSLKNAFRHLGPLRAKIIRTDLSSIRSELTRFENALSDAEVNLINDARDDRYDREALLDKLPEARHPAAVVILDQMEARHHSLLNRQRDVLQSLALRAETTQSEINRRIRTLDEEYAFIRTHIFWVRDAEPLGLATLAHARDEAARTLRALGKLACEPADRSQWGKVSADFVVAMVGLVVLPWPLRLGQRALDRHRRTTPTPSASAVK